MHPLHDFLNQLPEVINKIFDALDLLVIRFAILALAALGAYSLIKRHRGAKKRLNNGSDELSGKAESTNTSRKPCECGCGKYPKTARARFLPGHDLKKAYIDAGAIKSPKTSK